MDIKICGLSTPETVNAALDGGASHIGFIFFTKSPRNVSAETAGALRQAARGRAQAVVVTVNADDDALDDIVSAVEPDVLQLHGSETPERVSAVKARYGLPVMKALSISTADDLVRAQSFAGIADRLLFDAKPPKGAELPGGNGITFDWSLLATLDGSLPYMLSGGLNASNVGDALARVHPSGLDISSGVESAPGIKDVALIKAFFAAIRSAQQRAA
ncbi:phosphoribosylanthranilate isomerase [Tianweitania populi]|uniref:N-(5'-phosphoribosyl)anthranilate isomerase n=1 Tax=Tianweitania populi TaxID=1607949 RepID=A0A8J3DSQ7_9HYPH|nr:phosphoribosylanthranilate isomerase [Tianweitania populi]GHD17122.1 N-(5'-phosphoribosyl)anthranilate isomerase [Tianweitania populi]